MPSGSVTHEPAAGTALLAQASEAAGKDLAEVRPFPRAGSALLVPQTIEQATTLAQLLAKSEMLPKGYHDKPADVLVAILFGADLGLAPMPAIQSVACINGKPSLYGDGFLAVIYNHPQFKDHDEYYLVKGQRVSVEELPLDALKDDATTAVSTFWRHGRAKPKSGSFSIAQAKIAKLWGKTGPWSDYPVRQLMWRARGFGGRDMFPDGLRGMVIAEEATDLPVVDTQAVSTEPVLRMPARESEAQAPADPAPDPHALPDGCDRIVGMQRVIDKHPGYWIATTARGLKVWGLHERVNVEKVNSSGAETLGSTVRLTLGDKPWGVAQQVTKIEVVG